MEHHQLVAMSQLFKALSDPTRLNILLILLEKKECNVTTIVSLLNKEQSAVSHQLQLLRQRHLVKTRRDGKTIYYALDDDHVKTLLTMTEAHISHSYEHK